MKASILQFSVITLVFSVSHALNTPAALALQGPFAQPVATPANPVAGDGKPHGGANAPPAGNGNQAADAAGGNGATASSEQLSEIRRQSFEAMKALGYDADQLLAQKGYIAANDAAAPAAPNGQAVSQAPVIRLFRRLAGSPLVDSIVAASGLTGSKVVVVKLIQDALRLVLGAEVGVAEAESAESILEKETEYNDLIRLLKAVQEDKQEAATQKDAQAQLEASQARGQKAETLVEEIQRKFDSEQQKKRLQERKQNLEKELEGINSRLSGK